MDKFELNPAEHVKEGHEEGDISVRAIVWSGVFLAAGGFLRFRAHDWHDLGHGKMGAEPVNPSSRPWKSKCWHERDAAERRCWQRSSGRRHDVKPAPDWFGRGKMEDHLSRTFKDTSPRLQYDDEHDMRGFADSEEKWLDSTGKSSDGSIHIPVSRAMEILAQRGLPQASGPFQPANVGAPSAAYPTGAAGTVKPAQHPAGGAKK